MLNIIQNGLIFLCLMICLSAIGNDTLYFRLSNPWNTVKDPNGKYLRKCIKENDYYHVWDYNNKNILVTESYYTDTLFKTKILCHKYFDENERWLEQTRCYLNGRLDGYFVSYNKNGDTTGYDVYKNGDVVKSWSLHPEIADSIYKLLRLHEIEAEFPGGKQEWNNFLSSNLKYPSSLKNKEIKGNVLVSFTINIQGRIENIKIVKSLDPVLDQEVIRVVQKSPRWKPAKQNGRNVPSVMIQSIKF